MNTPQSSPANVRRSFFMPSSQADQSQATEIRAFRRVFSKDEIAAIMADAEHLPSKEATINPAAHQVAKSYRSSSVRWLPDEFAWVYERLFQVVADANERLWKFDLSYARDPIQYTEYHATKEGKYDWHIDIGNAQSSDRKVSVTVQLCDDYEGGDLELLRSRTPETQPKEAGTAVVFPSYLLHRVTPVTKGVRKSLVLWVCGKPFR